MKDDTEGDESVRDPAESEERIAALLRATGRRPPVAAARMERVRAAAFARWQVEVHHRARRRWLWIAAAAAAGAAIVVTGSILRDRPTPSGPSGDPAAVVERVAADAWMLPSTGEPRPAPSPLRAGERILGGTEITTRDRGRLALRLGRGPSVRFDVNTRVRVLSAGAIALDGGTIYVDSRSADGSTGPVEIWTSLGTLRNEGTQFAVHRFDTSLRVAVREGRVSVESPVNARAVDAGHALEVHADGRIRERALDPHSDDWNWIEEVTPRMRLEGRTLREFLDWVARERGLQVRFGDPDAARSASVTRLNGSIEELTLDQAIASVLATCGMSYRIEGDVLAVDPARKPPGSGLKPPR